MRNGSTYALPIEGTRDGRSTVRHLLCRGRRPADWLEQIDKHVVGPVLNSLEQHEHWRILVLPDHPTPVRSKAHSADPVPFAMAGTGMTGILHLGFGETNAAKSGFRVNKGHELMEYFLKSAAR